MSDLGTSEHMAALLQKTSCMALATVSQQGKPWNTPVFFASDGPTLYWASLPNSIHSQNIAANKSVFAVIFDAASGHGIYVQGTAKELDNETEVRQALRLLGQKRGRPFNTVAKYMPGGQQRIYKATAQQVWTNGSQKDQDGDFVADFRIAVTPF